MEYYVQSKGTNKVTPYIHFITTEELRKDLLTRGLDPDSEEIKAQYKNLLWLSGSLEANISSFDITPTKKDALVHNEELHCVPPNTKWVTFLKFPCNDTATQLNTATTGLLSYPIPPVIICFIMCKEDKCFWKNIQMGGQIFVNMTHCHRELGLFWFVKYEQLLSFPCHKLADYLFCLQNWQMYISH